MDQDIEQELKRIEGMIVGKGNGELRWWKILQVLCSIATSTVLLWGIWVTKQINSIEVEQARFRDWKDLGPRFTSNDAERLKLEVKEELRSEIASKLDAIVGKIDYLRNDTSELKYQLLQHANKEKP